MTSDYSRALDLDALANRYIMVESFQQNKKKMFLPPILLFLLQIDHRLLDCCIIAIILKQFPLCDSKGIQGACTFKVNCNHCAGIIKKCSTSTENYYWKQWIYQVQSVAIFVGTKGSQKKIHII